MINPITPDQVGEGKRAIIPDAVIETFNELIARRFSGNRAIVKQPEIVARLEAKGYTRDAIFHNKWLDVEPIYEQAGWTVEYEKPGYNERGDAFFTFTKGKV